MVSKPLVPARFDAPRSIKAGVRLVYRPGGHIPSPSPVATPRSSRSRPPFYAAMISPTSFATIGTSRSYGEPCPDRT